MPCFELEVTPKNLQLLKAVAKDSPVFISVVLLATQDHNLICSARILAAMNDGSGFYSMHPGVQKIHVGRFKSDRYWNRLRIRKYMQLRHLAEDWCRQLGLNYLLQKIQWNEEDELGPTRDCYLLDD
jgi:hypothetical protein